MCCNTKPGPKAAIDFFRKKTGIHITQADWHKLRTAAETHLGHKLSNKIADSHQAAHVAAQLADSLNATPQEKREFILNYAQTRNTQGNLDTTQHLATHGLPEEITNKNSRTSAQQQETHYRAVAQTHFIDRDGRQREYTEGEYQEWKTREQARAAAQKEHEKTHKEGAEARNQRRNAINTSNRAIRALAAAEGKTLNTTLEARRYRDTVLNQALGYTPKPGQELTLDDYANIEKYATEKAANIAAEARLENSLKGGIADILRARMGEEAS